jgi:hypothetical protein
MSKNTKSFTTMSRKSNTFDGRNAEKSVSANAASPIKFAQNSSIFVGA